MIFSPSLRFSFLRTCQLFNNTHTQCIVRRPYFDRLCHPQMGLVNILLGKRQAIDLTLAVECGTGTDCETRWSVRYVSYCFWSSWEWRWELGPLIYFEDKSIASIPSSNEVSVGFLKGLDCFWDFGTKETGSINGEIINLQENVTKQT